MPSALDMSLDDVIASKPGGGRKGKGRGGAKAANAGPSKIGVSKLSVQRAAIGSKTSSALTNKARQSLNTQARKTSGGGVVGSLFMKATAAAAITTSKAQASGAGAQKRKAGGKENASAPLGGGRTEDKLGMSLDDVITASNKKRPQAGRSAGAARGAGAKKQGRRVGGFATRNLQRVRGYGKNERGPAYGQRRQVQNRKGGGKGKRQAPRRNLRNDRNPYVDDRWGNDFDDRDDYGPPAKRARVGKGAGRMAAAPASFLDDPSRDRGMGGRRMPPVTRVEEERFTGGMRSAAGERGGTYRPGMYRPPRETVREEPRRSERAAVKSRTTAGGSSNTIKVSNVPRGLDDEDIREAFEDVGTVTRCRVSRGTASITFTSSSAAKKAVGQFNRGELNGQTIYVEYA